MFLVDTNVLSERRKGTKADPGVVEFVDRSDHEIFVPVQVIGELFSGVAWLRRRGDHAQASMLDSWLNLVLQKYSGRILAFDLECAEMWGSLMGLNDQHIVDRQIAAIALTYDLTVVNRNIGHFAGTGARTINPFLADASPGQRVP